MVAAESVGLFSDNLNTSTASCRHFVEEAKKVGARAYDAKTKIGEARIVAIGEAVKSGDFVLLK